MKVSVLLFNALPLAVELVAIGRSSQIPIMLILDLSIPLFIK